MHHPNRYVREAGHAAACALFRALAGAATQQAQGTDGGRADRAEGQPVGGGVLYPPPLSATVDAGQPGGVDLIPEQHAQQQQQTQQGQQQQQCQEQVELSDVHENVQGAGYAYEQHLSMGDGGRVPPTPTHGCRYTLLDLGMIMAPLIADGLTDNWSQVCRTFVCVCD